MRHDTRWLAVMIATLTFSACARKGPRRAIVDPSAWTAEMDNLWIQRGDVGMDVVADAWVELDPQVETHPDVRWRSVRFNIAMAMSMEAQSDAIEAYAEARAEGLRCLDGAPSFARSRAEWGWGEALTQIPSRRRLCASWLALAWTRWLEAFGNDAGALDEQRIVGLQTALMEDDGHAVAFTRDWSEALLLATSSRSGPEERQKAKRILERLIRNGREDYVTLLRIDLYRLFAQSDQDVARWCALRGLLSAATSRAPDVKRARSMALERGPSEVICATN